jgi:glycosyltransferase involved in cell wall biosynthesis
MLIAGAMSRQTVSVVLSTRNRPTHAPDCARTILANDILELILVDQSDDTATERAIAEIEDPRLRYVRSDQRGVTNGRNLGLELSRGDIIALTDDDCRIPPDWTARIVELFANDPDAMLVCGRVRVPEGQAGDGYGAEFEPQVREWQGRFPPPDRDWGITANFALRRAAYERVGPFDPFLGVGAPLRSGGEPDFIFRVIRAGLKVVNAREVEVIHLGVRKPGQESSALWQQYGAGTAAALSKHVRLGDLAAVRLYMGHLGIMARVIAGNAIRGRRPLGLRYTLAFLGGTWHSLRYPIDRERQLYRAP